jgi:gentisate 1,2-dioxygenase
MATRIETAYTRRARYYSSADGFNIKRPAVPAHVFTAERDRALDPAAPTGLIPLDLSGPLGLDFPATTPLILSRYARIRAGESLCTAFVASGELYYVMSGEGETTWGDEGLAWEAGDVFHLPGGFAVTHRAARDSLLYVITNEPELAFEHCRPPAPGAAPIEAVHYPADDIRRELDKIVALPADRVGAGRALSFANASLEKARTCLPSFTLAMNSLAPGESQRAHRHNAVAVTLIVRAEGCYSMVAGRRVDWQPHAVMITPPADAHSHHNDGDHLALFLIVQDGGLHYHTRTMGFTYE